MPNIKEYGKHGTQIINILINRQREIKFGGNMFYEELKKKVRETGTSLKDLSDLSGVSYNYLRRIISGDIKNPSIQTLESICEALRIDLSDIFTKGKSEYIPVISLKSSIEDKEFKIVSFEEKGESNAEMGILVDMGITAEIPKDTMLLVKSIDERVAEKDDMVFCLSPSGFFIGISKDDDIDTLFTVEHKADTGGEKTIIAKITNIVMEFGLSKTKVGDVGLYSFSNNAINVLNKLTKSKEILGFYSGVHFIYDRYCRHQYM